MSLNQNPYAAPATLVQEGGDPRTDDIQGPRGIRGWLLVALVSLCLSVPHLVLRLDIYGLWPWQAAWADVARGDFRFIWLRFIPAVLGDAILLAFTLVVLALFITRSRYAPRLMIACILARMTFGLLEVIVGSPLILSSGPFLLIQALVGAAWIAYFLKSRRVKNTFVR